MRRLDDALFKPVIGWIILALAILQVAPDAAARLVRAAYRIHAAFAWVAGLLVGAATMMANAAGPIFAPLHGLAWRCRNWRSSAPGAWFFLLLNAFKVPFSFWLGPDPGADAAAERPARARRSSSASSRAG